MKYFAIVAIQGKQLFVTPNRFYDLNFIKNTNIGDLLKPNTLLQYTETFKYFDNIINNICIKKKYLSLSKTYDTFNSNSFNNSLHFLVIQHFFNKDIIVFKYKPKKNYTKFFNFRSKCTRIYSLIKNYGT